MNRISIEHLPSHVRHDIYSWIGLPSIQPLTRVNKFHHADAVNMVHLFFDFYGPEHALYELLPPSGRSLPMPAPMPELWPSILLWQREDMLSELLRVMHQKCLGKNTVVQQTIRYVATFKLPHTLQHARNYGILCGSALAREALQSTHLRPTMRATIVPYQRAMALNNWSNNPTDCDLATAAVEACGDTTPLETAYAAIIKRAFRSILRRADQADPAYHSEPLLPLRLIKTFTATMQRHPLLARILVYAPDIRDWAACASRSLITLREVLTISGLTIAALLEVNERNTLPFAESAFAMFPDVDSKESAAFWVGNVFNACAEKNIDLAAFCERIFKATDSKSTKLQKWLLPLLHDVKLGTWERYARSSILSFQLALFAAESLHPGLSLKKQWLKENKICEIYLNKILEWIPTKTEARVWIDHIFLYLAREGKMAVSMKSILSQMMNNEIGFYDIGEHFAVFLEALQESYLEALPNDRKFLVINVTTLKLCIKVLDDEHEDYDRALMLLVKTYSYMMHQAMPRVSAKMQKRIDVWERKGYV